ncbi:hypothetical protein [Rhodopirellula sp. MGV]|uniref:hypothetical protein n=1 Tax=Rhodopirellula sp. MGV TaxID=2023130 RepID=UPI000B9620A0|nr:hypothetical protein [Rhodopirellula sp. MGV]OYP29935.1 hypothetical protein CGZ80_23205 [Rhodopirellula sp. MGV]PNY37576.1 hypothetical protein C2E31_07045 [Rhodopirellula baltica]
MIEIDGTVLISYARCRLLFVAMLAATKLDFKSERTRIEGFKVRRLSTVLLKLEPDWPAMFWAWYN